MRYMDKPTPTQPEGSILDAKGERTWMRFDSLQCFGAGPDANNDCRHPQGRAARRAQEDYLSVPRIRWHKARLEPGFAFAPRFRLD